MEPQHIDAILNEAAKHDASDPNFREGWHAAISAIRVRLAAAHTPTPKTARAALINGVTTCKKCGSTLFRYEENVVEFRHQYSSDDNRDGVLTFYWKPGNTDDGDGEPGVVCEGCELAVELPDGVSLEWRV